MSYLHADSLSGAHWLWITKDSNCIDILQKNHTVTLVTHFETELVPIQSRVSLIYIEECEIQKLNVTKIIYLRCEEVTVGVLYLVTKLPLNNKSLGVFDSPRAYFSKSDHITAASIIMPYKDMPASCIMEQPDILSMSYGVWKYVMNRDFPMYPVSQYPNQQYMTMFYSLMGQNTGYLDLVPFMSQKQFIELGIAEYVALFFYNNQYYGIPIRNLDEINHPEIQPRLLDIFKVFGSVTLQDNSTCYSLILESSDGSNLNIGVSPTYDSMMSNMAAFVMSYFDYNRNDIVEKGTTISFGMSDKEDDVFVDLNKCGDDKRDIFYHHNQRTMYNRRYYIRRRMQKYFEENALIQLSTLLSNRPTVYIGTYGRRIERFTYLKDMNILFGTQPNYMNLEMIPTCVFIEHVLKYLSALEYSRLCQVKKTFRSKLLQYNEQIWRSFLYRDYHITMVTTYLDAYKYWMRNSVLGVYVHPILTCKNSDLTEEVMCNLDSFNNHAFFIKRLEHKYSIATLGLHTNLGDHYYAISCKEISPFDAPGDLSGQIEFLFNQGYRSMIGTSVDGVQILFSEMKGPEYEKIKVHIECINAKNKLAVHERLKM